LEGLAEPGGICVSRTVFDHVTNKVDLGFEDLGEQKVKNIPKPLWVYRVKLAQTEAPRLGSVAAPEQTLTLPDKPSIAVLPFDNMSGDPEQEYFADGMAEEIITLLSSAPDLFVIARNSTFGYKGQSPDVRKVGTDLGVRYVLEGSVRKAANRIRVTAQFVDAQTGNHIWADKFDRDLEDIFAIQDEVAQAITVVLQSRLLVAEAAFVKRKPAETLDAWGNVVRAKIKLFAFRRKDIEDSEPFVRRAIELDPDYGEAHAVLGLILAWRSCNDWTDDWYQAAKDAVGHCERALALAPNDAAVLTHIGFAYWWIGRFLKALPILERANTLNPNSAMTCALYGQVLATVGRTEEGVAHVQRSLRLSPKDPLDYMFQTALAAAYFFAGRYELAKEAAVLALQSNPDLAITICYQTAACVRLGQLDLARTLLVRAERISSPRVVDNFFRPRTEGTLWDQYTGAIREVMDRAPNIEDPKS
jgi:adenylate cyclase